MKIIIQIRNDSKRMLEFSNLCIIKEELNYNSSGMVYGYAAVIKYPNDPTAYYEKKFTQYQYSNRLKPLNVAKEECDKYIDDIIQKIQTAVIETKKRHAEFTDIIELE